MGMQVTSLSMGSSAVAAAQQELPLEKRPHTPHGEQKAAAEQTAASPPESRKSQTGDLRQTASDLEKISLAFNRRLKFEIDQESREIRIKVIDNETDKVIKVLPPEELQRLHSRIRETFGFLFDRMV